MPQKVYVVIPAYYEYNDNTYDRAGWGTPNTPAYTSKEKAYEAARNQVREEILSRGWYPSHYGERPQDVFDPGALTKLIEQLNKRTFLQDEGPLDITPLSVMEFPTADEHWKKLLKAAVAANAVDDLLNCLDFEFNQIQEIEITD